MIKELFDGLKWLLTMLAKGVLHSLKGVSWFFNNLDYAIGDFKKVNRKTPKIPKKQEVF